MNVLMVWNGPANGEERSVLARREVAFLRHLAAQDVNASVALCGDAGGLADVLRNEDIPVHLVPVALPPDATGAPRIPFAAMHLRRLFARLKPDVIEATEPMPAIAAGMASIGNGSGTLIYRRQHGGGRMRLRLASRLAARLADRTIVSCEAMRDLASADDRSHPERIEIATTGTLEPQVVDANAICAARRSLGIPDAARVIGVIARLRHEKGIDVLIRSLDAIGVDDVHLVIAGSGPEERELRALAASTSVPVHFLGHRDDVARWLQLADVIAIPSRRESVGRITLEAMAAGKAIVASRAGGIPEAIVDGESGLLVPPEDERALAATLRAVLTDRSEACRLGQEARRRYRSRYTMTDMAASRRAAWVRTLGTRKQ